MYEQQLFDEINGLSAYEMERLLKLVHLVREEFIRPRAVIETPSIMSFAGCLKDLKGDEEAVFDNAIARRSLFAEKGQAL
jgi:hypothetical protein